MSPWDLPNGAGAPGNPAGPQPWQQRFTGGADPTNGTSTLLQFNAARQGNHGVPPQGGAPGGQMQQPFDWMQFLRAMGYGGGMPGMTGGGGQPPQGGLAMWNMMNPGGWGGQPQLGAYRAPWSYPQGGQ